MFLIINKVEWVTSDTEFLYFDGGFYYFDYFEIQLEPQQNSKTQKKKKHF